MDCVAEAISCVIYNMYISRIPQSIGMTSLSAIFMRQKRQKIRTTGFKPFVRHTQKNIWKSL